MKTRFYDVTLTLYFADGESREENFFVESSSKKRAIATAENAALDNLDVIATEFVDITDAESHAAIFDSCENWGNITDDWSYLDRI